MPLILSQTVMPSTSTITNPDTVTISHAVSGTISIRANTTSISLSALRQSSNLLIQIPENSLGTLVVTDESGQALFRVTEKPFLASAQELLSMVEREDRRLGTSI